jgi:hypothetical protein
MLHPNGSGGKHQRGPSQKRPHGLLGEGELTGELRLVIQSLARSYFPATRLPSSDTDIRIQKHTIGHHIRGFVQ